MLKKPVVGAIIQARTGSTRLPGKIFKELAGRPLLFHVLERLSLCKTLDKIVLATSTSSNDKKILDFAKEHGVLSFAGSEDDVQNRYIKSAEKHDINIIVRICSDSPFIDPEMIDKLVYALIDERADYAVPDPKIKSAQEGFEVFTLKALKMSRKKCKEKPNKEHVTWFIRQNPKRFQVIYIKPHPELRGKFRLSIDNYADYEFASAVYDALYKPDRIVDIFEMVIFLRNHPEIYKKNAHIKQKSMEATSLKVVFLVPDSKSKIDEHIVASIEKLARTLNQHYHCGIHILSCKDFPFQFFEEFGYKTGIIPKIPDKIVEELNKRKIDYIVSCGFLGKEIWKALTKNNYKVLSLIGRRELIIKELVTGHSNKGKQTGSRLAN